MVAALSSSVVAQPGMEFCRHTVSVRSLGFPRPVCRSGGCDG